METFAACKRAISELAAPFGSIAVEITTVGLVRRYLDGKSVSPLFVRIVYATVNGTETRQANVECSVDANDVVAVQVP